MESGFRGGTQYAQLWTSHIDVGWVVSINYVYPWGLYAYSYDVQCHSVLRSWGGVGRITCAKRSSSNRNEGRHLDKKQKEAYVRPMLVKHGILRDLTAQFDEWFQDGSRLTDWPENEKVSADLRTGTRSYTLPIRSSQRNDIS